MDTLAKAANPSGEKQTHYPITVSIPDSIYKQISDYAIKTGRDINQVADFLVVYAWSFVGKT